MALTAKLLRSTYLLIALWMCSASMVMAQDQMSWTGRSKTVKVADTIIFDSISINPKQFRLLRLDYTPIDSSLYQSQFSKAQLILDSLIIQNNDSIIINYLRYPNYLTKTYSALNPELILPAQDQIGKIYRLEENNFKKEKNPFSGINAQGSIVRGLTVGNNQNAVVNSQLDLQITGALSDKVQITASLQDSNLPGENGGYTQSLEEFDQLFIALEADRWQLRAGDVDLINRRTFFGQFTKKIQGMHAAWQIDHEDGSQTNMFADAGLVRGVFKRSIIQGQEGNQGPYKLLGANGEALILMISGSERIYVNGVLLERGENADYVIDYNAGEVRFNPTYPINSNMRITAEYQITERNYTRFIAHTGGEYQSENLNIGAYLYTEQDDKNQPLQQNFTQAQQEVLKIAGDDPQALLAPSEQEATYSENQILYKKELIEGQQAFVFSNNPQDELYQVRFTLMGPNQGDYNLQSQTSINKIFVYVPPIDGVPQGSYSPVIRLTPAQKLQLAGAFVRYNKDKTQIEGEFSASDNDLNRYSTQDDRDNTGYAGLINARQVLMQQDSIWQLNGFVRLNSVDKNYRSPELLYQVEFNRDWNLPINQIIRDQTLSTLGIQWVNQEHGASTYQFDQLKTSGSYRGQKHSIHNNLRGKKWWYQGQFSNLNTSALSGTSNFLRAHQSVGLSRQNAWVRAKFLTEDNRAKDSLNQLNSLSQKFIAYETALGVGDSTAVFTELGWRYRDTDSLVSGKLNRVGIARDVFAKAQLINNNKTKLFGFAQYRNLSTSNTLLEGQKSLNLRLSFAQGLWENRLRLSTNLEANNGKLPQQEFTYVAVEPGQGTYTWIDYNEDGIQDLDEFEIAQYQDQAAYVRLLLPNQTFIDIQRSAVTQLMTWQFSSWQNDPGLRGILAHFYSQTSLMVDRSAPKTDLIFVNPFGGDNAQDLALQFNLKQAMYFNRNRQHYTTAYIYQRNKNNQLVALGLQQTTLEQHQLTFDHKIQGQFLAHVTAEQNKRETRSENFGQRNFSLLQRGIKPKLSYFWGENSRVNVLWHYAQKENKEGAQEHLSQNNLGLSCTLAKADKMSLTGEINFINNKFEGSAYSSVAYLMLEGLQPGENYTWNVLWQKRINSFLDLNFSYFGRQSPDSPTIHTGSMQLRAFF